MSSTDIRSVNALKTDDELMRVLHESLTWARGTADKSSAAIYTNLRGALEDLLKHRKKAHP